MCLCEPYRLFDEEIFIKQNYSGIWNTFLVENSNRKCLNLKHGIFIIYSMIMWQHVAIQRLHTYCLVVKHDVISLFVYIHTDKCGSYKNL